jgi:hypothetical protein
MSDEPVPPEVERVRVSELRDSFDTLVTLGEQIEAICEERDRLREALTASANAHLKACTERDRLREEAEHQRKQAAYWHARYAEICKNRGRLDALNKAPILGSAKEAGE